MGDRFDLAHPGKILRIHGKMAEVDMGGGTIVNADIGLVETKPGDYVLVHAGYIISVLNMREANRILAKWRGTQPTDGAPKENGN